MWKNKNICGCHMSNDGKNNRQTNLLRLEKHDIALDLNFRSLITSKKTFMVGVLFWKTFKNHLMFNTLLIMISIHG